MSSSSTAATSVDVPIRDRFEIAGSSAPGADPVDLSWGHLPFAAVPSEKDPDAAALQRPVVGRRRPADGDVHTWRAPFFLWPWRNPHPDRPLERIACSRPSRPPPARLRGDAEPARGEPVPPRRRPRRAALARGALSASSRSRWRWTSTAAPPASVPAQRDRRRTPSSATRLPGSVTTRIAGGSPAYVEISAIPSATVRDRTRRRGARRACAGATLEAAGARWSRRPACGSRSSTPAATGSTRRSRRRDRADPSPAASTSAPGEGIPYQPHGHHGHVNSNIDTWHVDVGGDVRLGQITYAYIDGTCQGWLPRGEVIVDVARGFEYEPLRQRVTIEPGQQRAELRLKRLAT